MSILARIFSILNSPSRRRDIDYTKAISLGAKTAVFVLFGQLPNQEHVRKWLSDVIEDLVQLRPDFVPYWNDFRGEFGINPSYYPLPYLQEYLQHPSTESVAFLDFLELTFKNKWAQTDNDLIQAINLVLKAQDCPYKLTDFVISTTNEEHYATKTVTHYPMAYLAQDPAVETHAITPVLELFSDSAFAAQNKSFRTALERHKEGDYSGCITSCATAVEGSIKVVANKLGWRLKGKGVGSLAKSFIQKAGLPNKLHEVGAILAERRQNAGDAHGQEQVAEATEAEARFLIGLSAAFIVLVSSELP